MSYQERTEEWAPNPAKSEGIFVTSIVRALIETNQATLDNLEDATMKVVHVWRAYQAKSLRISIHDIRARMELSTSLRELQDIGDELRNVAMTKSERDTTMALYRSRHEALQAHA